MILTNQISSLISRENEHPEVIDGKHKRRTQWISAKKNRNSGIYQCFKCFQNLSTRLVAFVNDLSHFYQEICSCDADDGVKNGGWNEFFIDVPDIVLFVWINFLKGRIVIDFNAIFILNISAQFIVDIQLSSWTYPTIWLSNSWNTCVEQVWTNRPNHNGI